MKNIQTNPIVRLLLTVFLAFALILSSEKANATHSAGADFTYRCLGGLQYELTITFYRDCGGVSEPASIDITYRTLTGAYTTIRTATANKDLTSGQEITSPCTSATTKCNGGAYVGIRQCCLKLPLHINWKHYLYKVYL